MPLAPVGHPEPLPVNSEQDVRALFDLGVSIGRGAPSPGLALAEPHRALFAGHPEMFQQMEEQAAAVWRRGFADYFLYAGAVHPEYVRPLQREFASLSDAELSQFPIGFDGWTSILQGASDECVEILARKLREAPSTPDRQQKTAGWERQEMLAAILTPAALEALASQARSSEDARAVYEGKGFHIPEAAGQAIPRFFTTRSAIRKAPASDLTTAPHPIGLPPSAISDGDQPEIVWHYLTLAMRAVPGAPPLPFERLHLVSPKADGSWALTCRVSPDDRYSVLALDRREKKEIYAPKSDAPAQAILTPFDDTLTYGNGHVFHEGVDGVAGGPPVGLSAPPKCEGCGRVLFFIATIRTNLHDYGEGFRSLFVCEECRRAVCAGSHWN